MTKRIMLAFTVFMKFNRLQQSINNNYKICRYLNLSVRTKLDNIIDYRILSKSDYIR